MRVLITGAGGQLGRSLLKTVSTEYQIRALTRSQLDIVAARPVRDAVRDFKPDVIVNAAAYTAVDKAEAEREQAFAVNADGAGNLGEAALRCGARLIHISTDFVFDGRKSSPYLPADEPHPLGVYGASKAEGERRLQKVMGEAAVILRTGWVYAAEGHNFVNTILRLAQEKTELAVIADQVGTPTWAISLAGLIWAIIKHPEIKGVLHWSDAGVASWYDFAVAIQEEAMTAGLLNCALPIKAVTTAKYPLPAKRPAYSVLEKQATVALTGVNPEHWRANLRLMLRDLVNA